MAEIRPIVGNVTGSDRFSKSTSQNNQDPFSITGEVVPSAKVAPKDQTSETLNQMQQDRSNLLSELSKGLLKPITEKTNVQSGELRELVAATRILDSASGKMSQGLQEKIFISPEELQAKLVSQDKGETSFSGGAFDVLRLITRLSSGSAQGSEAAKELAKLLQNMNGTSAGKLSGDAQAATAMAAENEAMAATAAQAAGAEGAAAGEAAAQAAGTASVEEAYTQMLAQLAEEGAVAGLSAGEEAAGAESPVAAAGLTEEAALAGQAEEAAPASGAESTANAASAAKAETMNLAGSLAEAITGKQLSAESKAVQNSVVNILRHFDCYTNQDQSLQAIAGKLGELEGKLFKSDRPVVQNLIETLQSLIKETGGTSDGKSNPYSQVQNMLKDGDIMKLDSESMEKTQTFLKDQLVPELSKLVAKYNQSESIRNPITSIVHYIARYDKADPAKLSKALDSMGEVLSNIEPFTAEDAEELKSLILDAARDIRTEQKIDNVGKDFLARFGAGTEEKGDLAAFLGSALDDDSPAGVQKLALNLLNTMVDNESPAMPLMHFMIPIDYNGSNTYLEMYVDKDAEGRKGKADSAVNIFFTIESDDYGTFEVDMLERDGMIDLDIKAPAELQRDIRQARNNIRSAIENSGFRLALYRVAPFSATTSVASHFKELRNQKSGLDIKA